jgi:hypothetical protein
MDRQIGMPIEPEHWTRASDQRKIPLHLFTIGFQKKIPGFWKPVGFRFEMIFP